MGFPSVDSRILINVNGLWGIAATLDGRNTEWNGRGSGGEESDRSSSFQSSWARGWMVIIYELNGHDRLRKPDQRIDLIDRPSGDPDLSLKAWSDHRLYDLAM